MHGLLALQQVVFSDDVIWLLHLIFVNNLKLVFPSTLLLTLSGKWDGKSLYGWPKNNSMTMKVSYSWMLMIRLVLKRF